jgi:hypothetical protein
LSPFILHNHGRGGLYFAAIGTGIQTEKRPLEFSVTPSWIFFSCHCVFVVVTVERDEVVPSLTLKRS